MFFSADNEIKTLKITLQPLQKYDCCKLIKTYRKEHKLTQKQLAQRMGVNYITLRVWEQGKAKPPYNVWRLYKYLFE